MNKSSTSAEGMPLRGVHQRKIEEYFLGEVDCRSSCSLFDDELVLLAFTNRCGSNLLADYMRQTSIFSCLGECLNYDTVISISERNHINSFCEYICYLRDAFCSGGKILSLKASSDQIAMLYRFGVAKMFGSAKIVHIIRDDIVAQAVSFSIADQNNKWTSAQVGLDTEAEFKYEDILGRITGALAENQCIQFMASLLEVELLRVEYEKLVLNPKHEVGRICDFVGVDFDSDKINEPKISKQATKVNRLFCEKFKSTFSKTNGFT